MKLSRISALAAVLFFLSASALTTGGCRCGKKDDETSTDIPVVPSELQSELVVRNPAELLDEALALVRQFVQFPFDRNMLVAFALQRAGLPSALGGALELSRPIWLIGLDGQKLRERTPSLVALPIQSKQALRSALELQMQRMSADGELFLYLPKPSSPQLAKLKLWIGERYAVIASSRTTFDIAKRYLLTKLRANRPAHDLEALLLRPEASGPQAQQTLERLKQAIAQSASSGNAKLDGAVSALLLRYSQLLTTTPRLTVEADLAGTDVTLQARAESSPHSDLARAIKRQKTGPPFAMDLFPQQTWAVLSAHDLPDKEQGSFLGGVLQQLTEFFPQPQREELVETLSQASESFGGSLSVALHRAPDGGLGILALTRVTEPKKAQAAVDRAAQLVTRWADQKADTSGTKAKIIAGEVTCGEVTGKTLQLPLFYQASSESVSLLPPLLGDAFGVGWIFVRDVGIFSLGSAVGRQLELSCASLLEGKKSPFGESPAFKRALADSATRSGLFYLSLIDMVRALRDRRLAALQLLNTVAVPDKPAMRAISIDWGVDNGRHAFTAKVELPLGNLLLFKPLLDALGSTTVAPVPGVR